MIKKSLAEEVIGIALSQGGDYGELHIDDTRRQTIHMEQGKITNALSGNDFGASIRVLSGLNCVYAYTNDVSAQGLVALAKQVAGSIKNVAHLHHIHLVEKHVTNKHPIQILLFATGNSQKVAYLKEAYDTAINYAPSITGVNGFYRGIDQKIWIANSEGFIQSDSRTYNRLNLNVIADQKGNRQVGTINKEVQMGLEYFGSHQRKKMAIEAAEKAITLLGAKPTPKGDIPVVLARGEGTFVHECCGHALEGSCVSVGGSIYSNRLGKQVAHPKISVCDDGTMPSVYGSLNIDDEGIPATRNMLITDGILTGYMLDRLSARRLGMQPTGCGRKESYRFSPTSRMTNTFILPGQDKEEDIIQSVEYGLYVKSVGGGTAHVSTGGFDFVVDEAYMIENGEITDPVCGATINGFADETLMNITMVGDTICEGSDAYGKSGSLCGASSGQVPVTASIPMIKIKKLTVGGR